MDKEQLQQQLAELEKALQQAAANYNMIIGRIEEAKFWLGELEKKSQSQPCIDAAN